MKIQEVREIIDRFIETNKPSMETLAILTDLKKVFKSAREARRYGVKEVRPKKELEGEVGK